MMIYGGWSGLLILVMAGTPTLERAAIGLVKDLALEAVEGFSKDSEVALTIHIADEDGQRNSAAEQLLEGLIRDRLVRQGYASLLPTSSEGFGSDISARRAGAEWRLAIRGTLGHRTELSLWAELRPIDAGLWLPPPQRRVRAVAERRIKQIRLPSFTTSAPLPSTNRLKPFLEKIASLAAPVLALTACPQATPQKPATVFLLTPNRLIEFHFGKPWKLHRQLDLTDLSPSRIQVREPIGNLVCVENKNRTYLGFGHSGLDSGYVAVTGPALDIKRRIDGIPIAKHPDRGWLVARPDEGRAQLEANFRWTKNTASLEAEQGLLQLHTSIGRSAAWRNLAVTLDYRLVRLSEDLKTIASLAPSGVGFSATSAPYPLWLVLTASDLPRGQDRLRIMQPNRESTIELDVPGEVHASYVGAIIPKQLGVLAAARRAGPPHTDVFYINVDNLEVQP